MAIGIGGSIAGIGVHCAHMSRSEETQAQIEQACVDSLDANRPHVYDRQSTLDTLLATPSGPERLAQDGPAGR